jgi:hypothetical protein
MDTLYFVTLMLVTVGVIFWLVRSEKDPDKPDNSLFGMK